jgi:hypothetical protein
MSLADQVVSPEQRRAIELSDLESRLARVESLLLTLFGPNALGGSPPIPQPEPKQPQPTQRFSVPPSGFFR